MSSWVPLWPLALLLLLPRQAEFSKIKISLDKINMDNKVENFSTYITTDPIIDSSKEANALVVANAVNETIFATATVPRVTKKLSKEFKEDHHLKPEANLQIEQKEIDDAVEHGVRVLEELVKVKEPLLYKLGYFLKSNSPAAKVANFGAPVSRKAILHSRVGYAMIEATKKIASSYFKDGRSPVSLSGLVRSRASLDECPFQGNPKCPASSRRFRTPDGTCNNPEHPWRGSALLPMQRFLPPVYEDGIQSVRRSVLGGNLPSPRALSTAIHRDRNQELPSVTLMFTQWGQFVDHDVTSTAKSRSFNGSIPRCCEADGSGVLPEQFLHPLCLPIEVPRSDPFLGRFGIGCMEFTRSAPSTRFDCKLGRREQMNQATPYVDASAIYGSDADAADSIRTFSRGKISYGRPASERPADPPEGEVCRAGALSEECIRPGDGRVGENPGLIAIHTVFVRYHNKVAGVLATVNPHWSDERVYQETRRIVYSVIQHITYREYLPLVLGPEVMDSFELRLLKTGYYNKYDDEVNPAIANSFSTAAFRFGHSMVQNSFMRADSHHRPLSGNVSLHDEIFNSEHIWSLGSLDRLLLGMSNQPSQRRDEFMADELTNHLFQLSDEIPFGMDLAAINVQRGRDHGIPPYTFWRKPCGLSPVNTWRDLDGVMGISVALRLRSLYAHVDDIDLFTGGLAERPLKGAVSGPTFACIIAQQFANLRRGDRFWYETGGFESSFSPAQLRQIRRVTLAQVMCRTSHEIETVQPFVFLAADRSRNARVSCESERVRNFDLGPWAEDTGVPLDNFISDSFEAGRRGYRTKRDKRTDLTTKRVKPNGYSNKIKTTTPAYSSTVGPVKTKPTYYQMKDSNRPQDLTYLLGIVPQTVAPLQVNINIHVSTPMAATPVPIRKQQTVGPSYNDDNIVVITRRPSTTTRRPSSTSTYHSPTTTDRLTYFFDTMEYDYASRNGYKRPNTQNHQYVPTRYSDSSPVFEPVPFSTSNVPLTRPNFQHDNHFHSDLTKRPLDFPYDHSDSDHITVKQPPRRNTVYRQDELTDDILDSFFTNRRSGDDKSGAPSGISDKLDFKTRVLDGGGPRFVQVASVKRKEVFGQQVTQEDDGESRRKLKKIRVVDLDVMSSESSGRWKTYTVNEDDDAPQMEIPVLPMNVPCSHEVPRPMIQ